VNVRVCRLGTQDSLYGVGLSNEFWAIVIGVVIANSLSFCGVTLPEFIKMCVCVVCVCECVCVWVCVCVCVCVCVSVCVCVGESDSLTHFVCVVAVRPGRRLSNWG